ncbi:MAG TPA: thioredoxin domain-containing protein [Terriglobales bacterium]|jgi:uncharacterized protein YyaL (SSP411 family)|nr:thioredoxin domain-containing protein [Terriglobales bacterium]
MAQENTTQTSESLNSLTQNSLAQASSSYLRSAMHQPIHWHEWGEAAFAAARQQNKPVLLDIGAVWCHWCHVMDRESYENPEVAKIINEHFIAVKVDRDERPDVDSRYQAAVSAISGQGGWPLTAFLTPDGKPFYGGTYFPPEEHYGRPGFKRVLLSIAQAYQEKHGDVMESADKVMSAISHAEAFAGRSADFSPELVDKIVSSAAKLFDVQHGGFGSQPKFPHPAIMDLLIDRYGRTHADFLKTIITTTLEKMAQGGVYDQLAGGFHRYSVDDRWIVPHFEKMSYDNAGLLLNYVHGYQATRNEFFGDVARDIIRWMDEWLSDRERGGFYGSQDADINLDDDGDYFTWTVGEAAACLSEDEFKVATLHYDIGEVGEMHHNHEKNVLYVRATVDEISRRLGKPVEQIHLLLASAKKKMYAARLLRPTPYIDKTIYVNWNALCISAYLSAAQVLKLESASSFALKSLDRILAQAWDPKKGLGHVIAYSDPKAEVRHIPGMLDDYAYMTCTCLDAYEATADLRYFKVAKEIGDAMIARFYDSTSGGFFDTEANGNDPLGALVARRKPFQDSPTPAADPSAAIALLRLHAYTNDTSYREKAEQTLEVFAGLAEQYGMFAGTYGIAAAMFSAPHTQVVILEKNSDGAAANQLYETAIESFALNKSVLRISEGQAIAANLPPALAETIPNLPAIKEKTVAVVCSEASCKPPVSSAEELRKMLE